MNFGLRTLSQYDRTTKQFAAWRFNGVNQVGQTAYGTFSSLGWLRSLPSGSNIFQP